jgi:hypothetical protein
VGSAGTQRQEYSRPCGPDSPSYESSALKPAGYEERQSRHSHYPTRSTLSLAISMPFSRKSAL